MTLVAEIADICRFASARKFLAWAGLTPRVRNSDTTVHHGHITEAGSAPVRWVLGEAAQIAKRRPPFEATYESIHKRPGNATATVAIVCRLLAQFRRAPTARRSRRQRSTNVRDVTHLRTPTVAVRNGNVTIYQSALKGSPGHLTAPVRICRAMQASRAG
jgi:hypothetical protein